MILYSCPICSSHLEAEDRCVGQKHVCPHCGQRFLIPYSVKPVSWMVVHLFSLTLALALLGFLGWFVWMFPTTPHQSKQCPQDEQVVNLDRIIPPPLVQEVESPPREVPAPLPSPIPPPTAPPPAAKKRPPPPPPPTEESRRPDLPPPSPPAKDTPEKKPPPAAKKPPDPPPAKETDKKKQPLPNTDKGDAISLGEELVKAASEQQEALLEKLRQGKGPEYTQALAAAIGELSDEAKKKARQALADRLTRFTAKTLLAYLGDENPELRRAAALALGMKDDKDHIGDLIDMLEDPSPLVVRAVQAALKSLTGPADKSEEPPPRTRAKATPASSVPVPNPPSPVPKAKSQKRDDDLPDVSLVPPEETSPAVTAVIRANAIALHSSRAKERIQAAQVLGGLGEAGKPARRILCAAMLDPVIAVRVAAADALKYIDPKMHYLAVVLATEKVATSNDANRIVRLLEKIQKLEEDGEPLVPLVAFVLKFAASNEAYPLFTTALTTLSRIGRNDLPSYRVVSSALTNRDPLIRAIGLRVLARMKHGKLAVPRILVLLKLDTPANRIAAIEALTALADGSTEEIIAAAIAAQRYHNDEGVRRAVESALNKLETKSASAEQGRSPTVEEPIKDNQRKNRGKKGRRNGS